MRGLFSLLAWLCVCWTPSNAAEIHTVIQRMDMPRLLQIVSSTPAAVETIDGAGRSPLQLACDVGCVEMAEELLAVGANLEAGALLS